MAPDQLPIRIEVSRPRLIEGGPGVLRVRVVNLTDDVLICTLGAQSVLTDAWRDTATMLAPRGVAERRVPTKHLVRGTFVVHVSVDFERRDGSAGRLAGQVDRQVDALSTGVAPISVNITGGDGAVIDASHLMLGPKEDSRRVNITGGNGSVIDASQSRLAQSEDSRHGGVRADYEVVELLAEPTHSGLRRATLADRRGPRLHVVAGERLVVGRDPERADVLVPALEERVSRVHLECVNGIDQIVIHHRSRTNTTLLNQAAVTEDHPFTLSTQGDFTVVLGGTWRCDVRAISIGAAAASVRRGLAERGMHLQNASGHSIAGMLFTPDEQADRTSVPVLWLISAVPMCDIGVGNADEPNLVLSALRGLQYVRLAEDGRVLSAADLSVGTRLPSGRLTVSTSE